MTWKYFMSWIKEAKLLFINTPFGETKNIVIEKIFKQGASYGPVKPEEREICNKYGKAHIEISVFIDNILAVGDAEEIRRGIRNCMKIKHRISLKKTKIMVVRREKSEYKT